MRKLLYLLLAIWPTLAAAQVTGPTYTFTTGTTISPDEVNANFTTIYQNALNRTGGTMTGTLTTRAVLPDTNNSREIGASGTRYANIYSVLGNFSGALTVAGLTTTASVIPDGNGTRDLGGVSTRWGTIYGVAGNFSGTLTTAGVVPTTTDAYDIAGTGLRYAGAYLSRTVDILRADNAIAMFNARATATHSLAYAELRLGNDTNATGARLLLLSSAYPSSGHLYANGTTLIGELAGGLNLQAAVAPVRLFGSGLTTPVLTTSSSGAQLTGTYQLGVGADHYSFYNAPTLVEAASGTHANLVGAYFVAPSIANAGATTTNAFTVYVNGPPSGAVNNWALYAAAGPNFLGGDLSVGGNATITGRVRATSQPGFLAYSSATDSGNASGATVDFDQEVYDDAAVFSGNVFTAPVTGRYVLTATVKFGALGSANGAVNIVTSNRTYSAYAVPDSSSIYGATVTAVADMDAFDTANVTVTFTGGTTSAHHGGSPYVTFFSGRLIP